MFKASKLSVSHIYNFRLARTNFARAWIPVGVGENIELGSKYNATDAKKHVDSGSITHPHWSTDTYFGGLPQEGDCREISP